MRWTVFLEFWQQSSPGYDFAIGDIVDWPVVLVDGRAAGWPERLLKHGSFTLVSHPDEISQPGSVAVGEGIQAWWLGSEPPGSRLHIYGALREDHHVLGLVRTVGRVTRIQLLNQIYEPDDQGVLQPTWRDAHFTELTESTRQFMTVKPGHGAPDTPVRGDSGLVVTIEPRGDQTVGLRLFDGRKTSQ